MNSKNQDSASLRDDLRSKGLRATPARVAVLGFLKQSQHPVTHLDASEALADFEKSTLFRALADLTDAGLLRKMELGDHVWRFELITEDHQHGAIHPHLLCVDCGNVQCLDESQVELKASRALGPIEDVLLKGRCRDCRQ